MDNISEALLQKMPKTALFEVRLKVLLINKSDSQHNIGAGW